LIVTAVEGPVVILKKVKTAHIHNWLSVNGRPQDDFTRWNQLLNPTVILMYVFLWTCCTMYCVHDSFVHYAVNISKNNSDNNISNK